MSPLVVTAEELIGYLTEVIDKYGDIPVVVYSATSGKIESVGQPAILTVTPSGEENGFQAYTYSPREDPSKPKAALLY